MQPAKEIRTQTALGHAAVISSPREINVRELEFREPAAGEVRVRIEGCGVCASNLPLWQGKPWFEYPVEAGAPGHEAWGRVDAIGPGVTGLRTAIELQCCRRMRLRNTTSRAVPKLFIYRAS